MIILDHIVPSSKFSKKKTKQKKQPLSSQEHTFILFNWLNVLLRISIPKNMKFWIIFIVKQVCFRLLCCECAAVGSVVSWHLSFSPIYHQAYVQTSTALTDAGETVAIIYDEDAAAYLTALHWPMHTSVQPWGSGGNRASVLFCRALKNNQMWQMSVVNRALLNCPLLKIRRSVDGCWCGGGADMFSIMNVLY